MSEFTPRFLADYQPSPYRIHQTRLVIDLDDHKTKVTSQLSMEKVATDSQPLELDGEHLTLVSLLVDGKEIAESNYSVSDSSLVIEGLSGEFTLDIVTEIDPANNTALEGLYKSGQAYCTQCEAEGFRRITYYLDRPDVMSIFTTKVIGDKASYPYLLANGNPVERGQLENGKHFVTWHDPFPKPCYLFALVAGDFDLLADTYTTSSGKDVALEIFVDKGNRSKAEHAMASLKHSMRWDEETFGLVYDLDIYMIVAVDFFNMGAMENKGLNVFNSKYVLADTASATDVDFFNIEAVIAHEYFHNWTGNRITCRDWFQLSLKEGLTVFRDQQFSADMHSAAVTRIKNVKVLRAQQFAEDAGPMSHPIRPEKVMEMNNFYTLTVYEKGAEVIRMLHTLLGKQGFRAGMDRYFEKFDGMAVTCDDFVNAMAEANNRDLSIFKRWYGQSGTPEVTIEKRYFDERLHLTFSQVTPASPSQPEKQALHIPIKVEFIKPASNEVIEELLELKSESETWSFDVPQSTVVAPFAEFSAPVKVHFEQSDDELLSIVEHAKDSFSVWEAGQSILRKEVVRLMQNDNDEISESVMRTFQAVIDADIDPAFKALMLTLPSFDEVTGSEQNVNAQALVEVLERLKIFVANVFEQPLLSLFDESRKSINSDAQSAPGQRALSSVVLNYLAVKPEHHELVSKLFGNADNMTDQLAALTIAVRQQTSGAGTLLQKFEQQWINDTLVMDKWFSVNTNIPSSDLFAHMEALKTRPDFEMTNPNRVRALVGAFAMQNPKQFHCKSGQGYNFLANMVVEMDKLNPQVASRLITPLIQREAFSGEYQKLMTQALETIIQSPQLSKDITEKLNAALAEQ
ncbi:aminopeptidase N [Thalassotalea euphylliae]|uniref:aminopeptidase N n=1 Tax=Thalassotalea euphylliae TaxID=1655234 RepID=UPI003634D43C